MEFFNIRAHFTNIVPLLLAFIFVSQSPLDASTILYSNLWDENSTMGNIPSGYSPFAASFSTGSSPLELRSVTLSLFGSNYSSDEKLDVVLYSDANASPGEFITLVGQVLDSELPYYNYGNIEFSLESNVPLTPNTRYWIGIIGRTSAGWAVASDTSGIGVQGEYLNLGFGSELNGSSALRMEIVAIPEAHTSLLIAPAAYLLVMVRRRRS